MKAWLHSLVAAAIAAFSTSVTAAIADPASFNLTTTGLEHIAAVGAVAATLAVLALLRQSPLPDDPPSPTAAGTTNKVLALLLVLGLCCGVLTGCTDWERGTYQTLAASKAVVDQAHADYEARAIPKNQADYLAIHEAEAAQTLAVQAMESWELIKAAKGTQTALDAQRAIVDAALARLPVLIAAVKALYPAPKPAVSKVIEFLLPETIPQQPWRPVDADGRPLLRA